MSDATYRVFCEARKGSPLAKGEFEAIYSRVEAEWIEKVEAAVREQIARDTAEQRDAYLTSPDLDRAWIAGWHSAVDHVAARIARGEQR